ncbi:flagellar basal body-associated protein FliL [Photobacterium galatheae]|uniref:Flagellar protein FliL n=1 Tax=Photobacterium galatheae TaxID=1654360 RepID=A0A066S091_9GAMM|nr:flagellar basal body-associated protein FliL [Photobacterium galatheae]KDM93058.1 flagellar basal body-associated protein FliL [Photobacterium galatheae]MCM0148413.1 flagellar basal body-associated protein FliL [Photobacterium galatheae]
MAEEATTITNSKKRLILLLLALIPVLLGGGAAWYFLSDNALSDDMTSADVAKAAGKPEPAYYVILPNPFIFNVTGDTQQRLVQVKVQLMVRGDENDTLARQHIPLVESTLLQSFGAASVEQLRSPSGRLELRLQALQSVQSALVKVSGNPVIEQVLFTGFVMQ